LFDKELILKISHLFMLRADMSSITPNMNLIKINI